MSLEYEAIRSYITTENAVDGSVLDFLTNYERGQPRRDRRGYAISDGWSTWGHDDFNIAVWEGVNLVSWDWMDEPIEDAEGLAERAAGLGVRALAEEGDER